MYGGGEICPCVVGEYVEAVYFCDDVLVRIVFVLRMCMEWYVVRDCGCLYNVCVGGVWMSVWKVHMCMTCVCVCVVVCEL